ncbi:SUKH-3 domain-containing protein [Actinoplanes oblitus]|uniref:SUKH-3 domain-containing protein n=1 Tax=Actinoplanes oblitus TaxID=3040509 RepID=A0ABY8WTY9_9ACTN|nr:SUKH-3 domain-containing protein [Actinoplanes oblitus]WIM99809.1 SUKH-3 domain-containing protein [Actinoplanes oblitus]
MRTLDRFPPDLAEALGASGWTANRQIDVQPLVAALELEGHQVHSLAREVFATLSGLSLEPVGGIGPNFFNDEPFNIDPILAGSGQLKTVKDVESILRGKY